MTGYDKVISALDERGLLVSSWQGAGRKARCPSHDDKSPSLSVSEGDDGTALVYCHAGCDTLAVVEALGLGLVDLFGGAGGHGKPTAAIYTYVDERGEPLYRVHRTSPKGFWQERLEDGEWKSGLRDVRRVIYRLPQVLGAIRRGESVFISEGEKDAERLAEEGVTATTLLGGAGKWRDEYAVYFEGANVVIIGDNDDAGRNHVSRLRLALMAVASSVSVLWPRAEHKDATEHLDAGFTLEELVEDETDLGIFAPVDWKNYEAEPSEWLFRPWVPANGRVLAFGMNGSLKSLWAMWLAAKLSQEGKRVAYFSMEMTPQKTVDRLRQLDPDPRNFVCFTKNLDLSSPSHVDRLLLGLRNHDLIVIDSWTAVHQFGKTRLSQNDEVAALDRDVFQPLMDETGATILMLDNTGHDVITDEGRVKQAHARGASAKGDKMEVCIWLDRPDSQNNYRTRLTCTKMRLNEPTPAPVTIETPQDRIEFYVVEGGHLGPPFWPSLRVDVSHAESGEAEAVVEDAKMSWQETLALARLKDKFKAAGIPLTDREEVG